MHTATQVWDTGNKWKVQTSLDILVLGALLRLQERK